MSRLRQRIEMMARERERTGFIEDPRAEQKALAMEWRLLLQRLEDHIASGDMFRARRALVTHDEAFAKLKELVQLILEREGATI